MANEPVDLHVENEHLRKQLDTLPSCLMRIGMDGIVLAANDAARNLLGAASLNEVLNMPFTAWIGSAHHESWREFTTRVASGSASSLECEITALSGAHRSALLHGIPVLDHPDRLPSMLVAARDVSDRREIESSLEEREGKIRVLELELDNLQSQLAQAVAERGRLEDQLGALETRQNAERQSTERQAEAQADERRQIEAALVDRLAVIEQLEAHKLALQAQVDALRADAERLTAIVRQLEAQRETEDTAHAAERDRFELDAQLLTERFEHQTTLLLERHERQIEDSTDAGRRWQAESLGLRAAIEQLEASLRAKEQELARLETERAALRDRLELREQQEAERPAHLPEPDVQPLYDSLPLLERREAQEWAARELHDIGASGALPLPGAHSVHLSGAAPETWAAPAAAGADDVSPAASSERDHEAQRQLEIALAEKATQLVAIEIQHAALREQLEEAEKAARHESAARAALVAQHEQALAAQATAREQMQTTLAERVSAVEELTAERDRLRQDRDRARAAREVLEQSLSELDHERLRLVASHETERARLLAEVEAATGGARHVEERLESQEAAIARLEAELAVAGRRAEQQQREALEAHDLTRGALEAQLKDLRMAHAEIQTALLELDARHARVSAERDDARATLTEKDAAIAQLTAALAEAHQARDHQRQIAETHAQDGVVRSAHQAERRRLEALVQETESQSRQHEIALEAKTRELRDELASQTALLEQAVTERRRLHSTLQMRDIATQALIAERASERQKYQQALALSAAEQHRVVKLVADQQVELTALTDEMRGASQLATAGRLAMDVGRDLRQLLDDIDAHAKRLLVECPVDGHGRRGIETLRADALRAASLGRQFLQAASGAHMFPGADSSLTGPQRRM